MESVSPESLVSQHRIFSEVLQAVCKVVVSNSPLQVSSRALILHILYVARWIRPGATNRRRNGVVCTCLSTGLRAYPCVRYNCKGRNGSWSKRQSYSVPRFGFSRSCASIPFPPVAPVAHDAYEFTHLVIFSSTVVRGQPRHLMESSPGPLFLVEQVRIEVQNITEIPRSPSLQLTIAPWGCN